jgi:hypothetical protein
VNEQETIEKRKNGPNTVVSLEKELFSAGLRPGMTVLLHSSLSSLGWVCGGPVAVILAFQRIELQVEEWELYRKPSEKWMEFCDPAIPRHLLPPEVNTRNLSCKMRITIMP